MLMKLIKFFKKNSKKAKSGRFSDFLLHASEKEKQDVLKEAARKANEDQRELFSSSRLKTKTS